MIKKILQCIMLLLFVAQGFIYAQDPVITITKVDTAFALVGMPLQPVLKIKINNPSATSVTLQKVVVKSLCQDSTDVDSVSLYHTILDRFSISDYQSDVQTQIGNKKKFLKDTVVFSGFSYALDPGDNYLWIMLDVSKTARIGHYLDASIRAGGIEIDYALFPATNQSPKDSITINSIYYRNNFENYDNGNKPQGWTQYPTSGLNTWYGYYGGAGLGGMDNAHVPRYHYINAQPSKPKSGKANAALILQNSNPISRWLISPPIDLSLVTKANLVFYHSQVIKCADEACINNKSDELEVFFQVGGTDPTKWQSMQNYPTPTANAWYKRELLLPDTAYKKNVYIAFKGTTRNAWGVCLDSMIIYEAGSSERTVKTVEVVRATSAFIPQGTTKNPIIRANIRVKGNSTVVKLTSLKVTTKNQNDADIVPNGVKLFSTVDSLFISPVQVGTGQSISEGEVTFSGLNKVIESGDNYFWLTYDIKPDATPDDTLAAFINMNDIVLNTGTYPTTSLQPKGSRTIKQNIFFDDFETDKSWNISVGDFQRQNPLGKGGSQGQPDPTYTTDGANVLGNDLSGLGSYHGDYEPSSRSLAVSPVIPGKYFKNIHLSFNRWLNAEAGDSACVEYKYAGSNKWNPIWINNSTIVDTKWQQQTFDLTNDIVRSDFNLRFRLGTTNTLGNFSGWNLDYLFVTGDSIKYDAAVTKILEPLTSCDLSANEKIKVRIKNTGPKPISHFQIKFSKDGGETFVTDNVTNSIPVGDSLDYTSVNSLNFSKPAIYNILAKVVLGGDNYPDNDTVKKIIISLPTYQLPFKTGFEEDSVLWTDGGELSSWKCTSFFTNNYIKTVAEGAKTWITTNNYGQYNDHENSYVESPCFVFDTNTIPIVDFASNYYTNPNFDGAMLQYSLNQGASWQPVVKDPYSFNWNWYNDTIKAFNGVNGWTNRTIDFGGDQAWVRQKQVLPNTTIGPKVKFRIVFKCDTSSGATYDGFAFDDFRLYNAPHDLGVTSIDNIVTPACQFGANSNPNKLQLTVKNFGIRDMLVNDSILIGVKINNSTDTIKEKFILASNLLKGNTVSLTMTKPVNITAVGNYAVKVFTLNEKDPNFYGPGLGGANDATTVNVVVNPNPVPGLKDTLYTNRPNKATIQATDSAYFNYDWSYPKTSYTLSGYEPKLMVSNTGLGRHRLTVTNNNTGCVTKDSTFVKLLISDVGLTKILQPITHCGYGANMNPIVEIKNFGTDTLKTNDTIPLRLELDGGAVMKDTLFLASKLNPGATIQATMSKTQLSLTVGAHTIKAYTKYPADTTFKNDTIPLAYRTFQIHGYPTVELGADTTVKKLQYTIRPKSVTGSPTFKWSDGNVTDSMMVTQSGKYLVTVTNAQSCEAKDSVNVRLKIHDIGIKRLVNPQNSCSLPSISFIEVKLINSGTDTIANGESITMSYRVNDTIKKSQPFNLPTGVSLYPGDSISCSFSSTVDISKIATHKIEVKAVLTGDIRNSNDSILQMISVFGKPKPTLPPAGLKTAANFTLDPGIGFKSYLWQNGSVDTSFVITRFNNDNKNYSVTVTDANGCSETASTTIFLQVYDLELSKIYFDDACNFRPNEVFTVKVSNKGYFADLVDNDVTLWYRINGGAKTEDVMNVDLPTGSNQNFTFINSLNLSAPGTYTITAGIKYGLDTDNTNDSIVLTIKNHGYPVVNFGSDTLKVDLPVTLDAGAGTGYTYLWSNGSTTQTISAASSGNYSVTVTNLSGCKTEEEVYVRGNIIDLALDGFGISLQHCKLTNSETIGLKVKNTGNTTLTNQTFTIKYKLDGGTEKTKEVVFTGAPGATLSYSFDGKEDLSAVKSYLFNASLVYASDKVASNDATDYTVAVTGLPQINDFGAVNDTIKLTQWPKVLDAGAGFKSYLWQDGSTGQTFSTTTKGIYTVTVTDNNNCVATKSVYIFNTGVRKLSDQAEMTLYPNPVRDILNLKLNLKKKEAVTVEIISSSGKPVITRKLNGMAQYHEQIDVYLLPRGMYYVRVSTGEWVVTDKVIVE